MLHGMCDCFFLNWMNNRIGPCFVTFVNFHCPRLSISPVDSFSLTLAGCCAKNIPRLKQRAKESIYPTSKMIQYCVSKRSKSHRSNEWLKTGGDPWIFTVKCTILDIWVSDNVIIACTFIVLNTISMQLSHNNIIYLIFFQLLSDIDANRMFHLANDYSRLLLGRDIEECLVCSRYVPLDFRIECYLAGE